MGDANHNSPNNKTWTMSKKSITITANPQTINYGETISNSTSDVTVSSIGSGVSVLDESDIAAFSNTDVTLYAQYRDL